MLKHISLIISLVACMWVPDSDAAWEDVKEDVGMAAIITDSSAAELATVGFLESSFRAKISSKRGSAKGLMQITKPTWRHLVKTYGDEYSITMKTPRTNARANAIMAALYLKENRGIMERKLRRRVTLLELYLGHKFGPERAVRLLRQTPSTPLVKFYPEAATRNYNVYYRIDGTPRTIAEVRTMFGKRVRSALRKYGAEAKMEVLRLRIVEYENKVREQEEMFLPIRYALTEGAKECTKKPIPYTEMAKVNSVTQSVRLPLGEIKLITANIVAYYADYKLSPTSGRKFFGSMV